MGVGRGGAESRWRVGRSKAERCLFVAFASCGQCVNAEFHLTSWRHSLGLVEPSRVAPTRPATRSRAHTSLAHTKPSPSYQRRLPGERLHYRP